MTNFIPKDRSGAYRPWKLTSLEGGAGKKPQDDPKAQAERRAKEDADRIKMINQQAYREGYDAGYARGAAVAAGEAARLADLVESARQEMRGLEQNVAEDLVRLALTLARTLVRESLKVHPEMVQAIVRETVRDVPPFGQGTRLRVNPEDAALLTKHLGSELDAQWSIVGDETMTRGGCRVESATGEIDASMEIRWQKLCAALAQDHAWIA
jgi:flagellar assembly protein FliH